MKTKDDAPMPRLSGDPMVSGFRNPIAHTDDPSSSREAAAKAEQTGMRKRHADRVERLVAENPGETACELAAKSDLGEYQIRRRLTDLLQAGRIVRGPQRKCSVKGTTMVTWFSAMRGEVA